MPINTRLKLAHVFAIPKLGPTHVSDNTIQSDGFLVNHIETNLTRENIQTYLKTNEPDMEKLWQMLIEEIEGRVKHRLEEKRIEVEVTKLLNEKAQTENGDTEVIVPPPIPEPESDTTVRKKRKYTKRKIRSLHVVKPKP